MPANRRSGGAWVPAGTVRRRVSGAWVTVTSGKRRSGGAWIETLAVLAATIPDANGAVFVSEPAPATQLVSAGTTVSATGGSGSYTYSWAYLSGDTGWTFTNGGSPAGISPSWSSTIPKNAPVAAVWRCTISDGVTSITRDINITLSYTTDL